MKTKELLKNIGEKIFDAEQKRLIKLIDIRAPQILIDNRKEALSKGKEKYSNLYVDKINIKKCPSGFLDFDIISNEPKIGNGGKKYVEIVTNNGKFNFFPSARYGAIVLPSTK